MQTDGIVTRFGAAITLLILAAALPTGYVRAQDPEVSDTLVFQVSSPQSHLQLIENTSRIIQVHGRITRVDGFDPTVIKVTTLPQVANQIRVQAMAAGVTTLVIVDEFNNSYSVEIAVMGDVRQLEALIKRAFPESSVQATKVKDSVLLMGWVNQPDQLTPIIEIAEQFHPKVLNYLKVGGVQQVMLRVKIMEVQRAKVRSLGINFLEMGSDHFITSTPGGMTPVETLNFAPPEIQVGNLGATTATFGIAGSDILFQGFIEALKEEKLLKILAEPNLVTVNGRKASFISGGEFPIPIPQSLATVTIEFKEFGVQLEFVPNVLSPSRLRMDVIPEVSEQDLTKAVTFNGTTIPGLTKRKVNTQVEMNFGQTLIIGGLLFNRVSSSTAKTPFLGELPWIGAAFRRVKHDEAETELLIMVTPELAAPLEPGQCPPLGPGMNTVSPTDRELFGLGLVEVPRVGPDCEQCPPYGAGGQPLPPHATVPGVVGGAPAPRGTTTPLPPPLAEGERAAEPLPPARASTRPADPAAGGSTSSTPRRGRPGLIAPGPSLQPVQSSSERQPSLIQP